MQQRNRAHHIEPATLIHSSNETIYWQRTIAYQTATAESAQALTLRLAAHCRRQVKTDPCVACGRPGADAEHTDAAGGPGQRAGYGGHCVLALLRAAGDGVAQLATTASVGRCAVDIGR